MSEPRIIRPDSTLGDLQDALKRIPGVQSARVVGDDSPREIHVVAAGRKPSRQFVRDIEALASAEFGIDIDHRIVSIVQVDDAETQNYAGRPSIEKVSIGRRDKGEWVEVTLRWPTGEKTSGTGAAGNSREARARGAAAATLECLDPKLATKKSTLEVEHVTLHAVSTAAQWVLVQTSLYEKDGSTPLLGAAQVVDDVATAAVRALLNAVNRQLLRT